LADREVLIGIKSIGDWLTWPSNNAFKLDWHISTRSEHRPLDRPQVEPRSKFCVETFLKIADPARFAGADMPALAYWKELPSRTLYRTIAAELAKNPT
jgi:hypothetical protein